MNSKQFKQDTEKLIRAKLVPIIESLGFQEMPRKSDNPTKFAISFERETQTDNQYLYIDTLSWLGSAMLFRFKVLSPVPLTLTEFLEFDEQPLLGWGFNSIDELKEVLDEVIDLVKKHFKQWIQDPRPVFQPVIPYDPDARLQAVRYSIIGIEHELENTNDPKEIAELKGRLAELKEIQKRTQKEITDKDKK